MRSKIWIVLLGALTLPMFALRVELSNDTFATSGRSANRNLFVTNNSGKMIALEVYAQSRIVNETTGIDELDDIEDFLIYPNQLLLQPDEQQVVTLTWVGPQELPEERAFRIVVEELNLSLDEESEDEDMTVKLAALTKVVKAAYVAPENAKANVKVSKSEVATSDTGKKVIRLTLKNTGTAHKILKQTLIKLTPVDASGKQLKDQSWEYIPDELNGVINILARSQRIIEIEWPDNLSASVTEVNVTL
ncbi:MAG: hypothetical protein VW397_07110 [Candidatus Margulisiibacteriota bacterium]